MIAAENDFLPGAKVGGVGDVIRDLPPALVMQGEVVDVVLPSYGFLVRLAGMELSGEVQVFFSGVEYSVEVYRYQHTNGGATNYVLHHSAFAPNGESVYCNDDDNRPFATDATKYALFCAAVAQSLIASVLPRPNVLHCHDWHTAFLLILIRYSSTYSSLSSIKTVFTIHNLALQGVRPFKGDDSSLESWYPNMHYDGSVISDTVNPHCLNPMRAAILLADRLHTVSPSYAKEVLQASDYDNGIYGGEGLERDLLYRHEKGDLFGIINGCEYPKGARYASPAKKKLCGVASECLVVWASKVAVLASAHFVADKRLQQWLAKKSRGFTLCSIGRVTEQKVKILATRLSDGKTALEHLLILLGDKNQFLMLGSGDNDYEDYLVSVSGQYSNFIFLNGYSHDLSLDLYRYGDLFLMPSSFEPCGISQMLAMRAAQPCLVNSVGGLKDTVIHDKTGFCFSGNTAREQAEAMLAQVKRLLVLHEEDPSKWKAIVHAAADSRFTWEQSAKDYVNLLYK